MILENLINLLFNNLSISYFDNNPGVVLKSIKYGLDETKALEALTTIPAKILGKESEIGTLSKGKQVEITTAIDKRVEKNPTISSFTKEREILKNTYDLKKAHKDAVAAASAAGGSKMNRKTRKKRK